MRTRTYVSDAYLTINFVDDFRLFRQHTPVGMAQHWHIKVTSTDIERTSSLVGFTT